MADRRHRSGHHPGSRNTPKLLLPISGGTMIEATLAAWRASRVDKVVVVVRTDDQELAIVCRAQGADVVLPPVAPPEMKDSVQYGLRHIEANFAPTDVMRGCSRQRTCRICRPE